MGALLSFFWKNVLTNYKFFTLLFFLSSSFLYGKGEFSDFDSYQGKLTREEIAEKFERFLKKEGRLSGYISLTDERLCLLNAPYGDVEYTLVLAKERVEKKGGIKRSLAGMKIAIDPGHLGGQYARLEARYIDIPPSLNRPESIRFDEGTLTFLTALELKVLLEREGAIVFLTRDQIGRGVYEDDFFDWLRKNPLLWNRESSLSKLFCTHYNLLDLRARAEKINAFTPDLTIIIHYNSKDGDGDAPSNHAVVPQNYNLVFIPGAFCLGELSQIENRYQFFRLLLTDDLWRSLQLSSAILTQMGKHLHIPPVSEEDGARYLDKVCLRLGRGVYARNLALTRLVQGPLCYGETLIQNNIDECEELNKRDYVIGGVECSSRIKAVADAYFEGIKNYWIQGDGGVCIFNKASIPSNYDLSQKETNS